MSEISRVRVNSVSIDGSPPSLKHAGKKNTTKVKAEKRTKRRLALAKFTLLITLQLPCSKRTAGVHQTILYRIVNKLYTAEVRGNI